MKKMKFTDFLIAIFFKHISFCAAIITAVIAGAYLFFDVNVIGLLMDMYGYGG